VSRKVKECAKVGDLGKRGKHPARKEKGSPQGRLQRAEGEAKKFLQYKKSMEVSKKYGFREKEGRKKQDHDSCSIPGRRRIKRGIMQKELEIRRPARKKTRRRKKGKLKRSF